MEHQFTQLFPNNVLTKSQRRQLEIVQGAIRCLAKHGFDETNLGSIAKSLKISRPLVQHYFSGKDELILLCARSVRLNFQEFVVHRLPQSDWQSRIKSYVKACFDWTREKPDESVFWAKFLVSGISKPEFRKFAEEASALGRERIRGILEGRRFRDSSPNSATLWIQACISGGIFFNLTDDHCDLKTIEKLTLKSITVFLDANHRPRKQVAPKS